MELVQFLKTTNDEFIEDAAELHGLFANLESRTAEADCYTVAPERDQTSIVGTLVFTDEGTKVFALRGEEELMNQLAATWNELQMGSL